MLTTPTAGYPDLRTFVQEVEQQIRRVSKPVSSVHELSAVVKLTEKDGAPAVFFENVDGGTMPVISGLFATRGRIAAAMGVPTSQATETFIERIATSIPATRVEQPECHEVVHLGDDVNLDALPNPVHSPLDGGRYITAGVCLVRDPVSGAHNAGIYRIMIQSKNQITILAGPEHDLGKIIAQAARDSVPLDVAIVIGSHPALHLASQAKVPIDVDSLDLMGSLMDASVPIVRGKTVDIDVPANSEIVIEGRIMPGAGLSEGPFGEFSYYYGSADSIPVCEVSAITHRADAWYLDIHPAHDDHRNLWLYPGREVRLLQLLQSQLPSVTAVHLPLEGAGMVANITLDKQHDGDARRALMIALSSDIYIKHAFVFDPDIDIYDVGHALWALGVRFQADTDLFMVTNSRGFEEDPSSYSIADRNVHGGLTTKAGFDVTIPLGAQHPQRADLLPEGYEHINLSDYLD